MSALTDRVLKNASETDPETGCKNPSDKVAFELCRQNYFAKQANLQQQSSGGLQQENTELKAQVKDMQIELATLKSQPTSTEMKMEINENGNVMVLALILITIILTTVLITRYFAKK